jgi:hypothetical protein
MDDRVEVVVETRTHLNPLRSLGRIQAAAEALDTARRELDQAVADARQQNPPASWAAIGRAVGMSRQAARERWATATDTSEE